MRSTNARSHFGWIVFLVCVVVYPASAQPPRTLEIGANFGYTLSEGVSTPSIDFDGNTINEVGPTDAFAWGFTAGAVLYSGWEIDFLWARQESELTVSGPGFDHVVSSMNVDNYHGLFTYNFPTYRTARPFLFGGLGATRYSGVSVEDMDVDGETQFSTTWGGGIKVYPQDRPIGLRLMIRWTPTYIKSDPGGVWCDPYWGCTQTADAEYSHQWEFTGGLIFGFKR